MGGSGLLHRKLTAAPMVQPTKDELRGIIRDQQSTIRELRTSLLVEQVNHGLTKLILEIATRKIGEFVIGGLFIFERPLLIDLDL